MLQYDKFIPMGESSKVAISLDAELLRSVETLRARTGESRSAVFSRAVRQLLRAEEHEAKVASYRQGYLEAPESEAEFADLVAAGVRTLAEQDW